MVPRVDEAEEVALSALRRFGDRHRDWVHGAEEDPNAERVARIALFSEAYRTLEQGWSRPPDNAFFAGRDTRPLKALEEGRLPKFPLAYQRGRARGEAPAGPRAWTRTVG